MSKGKNKDKAGFINLFLSASENDSNDTERAKKFLESEGVDIDKTVADGLKRIRQMEMSINAEKTKREMLAANDVKGKAMEWVDNLLNSHDFSLPALIQQEELSVSFRNVEELSKEDLRNLLIKHYTLKFMKE